MKKGAKNNYLFIGSVIVLALVLRFWNVIAIGDGFYANFLSDASTYRLWASNIVAGSSYGGPAFPMGPLYPYFLAACLNLGFSFYSVLFLQAVFGAAVVFNIYIVSNRLFGSKAGLISALMAAVYGPFVFYDGLLLSESLQLALMSVALVLIIPPKAGEIRLIRYFAAGILIGLTALGRGTILIFPVLLIMYWLFNSFKTGGKRRRRYIRQSAVILVGIFCGILPATLHNISNGEYVPISSNFGINLYIGNNPDANGSYQEPRGLNLSSDFTGRQIAEKESGRQLKSSEVSKFWSGRAYGYIAEKPLEFIGGLFAKLWLYLWYFDIPQAESIQIHHRFSPVFWILPSGYWFILITGILGMVLIKKNERGWLIIFLLLAGIGGGMIFFVIGRFKLLGSMALLIFSGGAIYNIYRAVREKDKKNVMRISAVLVFTSLILFLPRPINRQSKIASAYDNVGISYYFKNQPDKAIRWYRKAVEVQPGHSGALNNIGGYFYIRQRPDSAIYYFHKSIQSDSTDDKAYQNLGRTFQNLGAIDSAYHYYRKAKSHSIYGVDADKALRELDILTSGRSLTIDDSTSFEGLLGLAEQYAAQKRFDLAETFYRRALEMRPDNIRALNNLGFTCQARGKYDQAYDMFSKVIELSGGSGVAYNNLASVVYRKGLVDSAEVLWEKALIFDPENAQIRKNLDFIKKSKNR
jgi:Tfp pilus assembly protein PilF